MKPIRRLAAKIQNFACLACWHRWTDKAGPTQCPACGHVYVKATDA